MIKTNFKPEHFTARFPSPIKPARAGWYRVDADEEPSMYAFWDGHWWGWACFNPNRSPSDHMRHGAYQHKEWYGLNHGPNLTG